MSRTLTSAWIETATDQDKLLAAEVALSRVRGLKRPVRISDCDADWLHSHECVDCFGITVWDEAHVVGRTLTSAWIETIPARPVVVVTQVALSRVRGLKPGKAGIQNGRNRSHSHECVD